MSRGWTGGTTQQGRCGGTKGGGSQDGEKEKGEGVRSLGLGADRWMGTPDILKAVPGDEEQHEGI